MNRNSSQIRLESQNIPTVQEILEGLNENEIRVIFDLILLLKERRKRNKTAKAADPRVPNSANGVDDRLWFLIELIHSFMDLYSQDDDQLVEKIGAWFKDLDYAPTSGYIPDAFPAKTMDLFEGLDDKVLLSIIRLVAFFHREGVNARFGEDPSRIMVEMDAKSSKSKKGPAKALAFRKGQLENSSLR